MTTYSVFLECGDPDVTYSISSTDTILVTVGASYGTTGNWLSLTPTGCTINFTSGSDGSTTTLTPISGASSYSVTFRTRDTNEAIWYSSTLSGTISSGSTTPTYSVANASTNEGASATVNVTTTNVANGTTLFWTVAATTADVSTTSGSFTINSNAGSFTIPAIADSLTETNPETYTISIRTGSIAGTVEASSTLTINDTSTTPAAATYAINFYDPAYNPKPLLTKENKHSYS